MPNARPLSMCPSASPASDKTRCNVEVALPRRVWRIEMEGKSSARGRIRNLNYDDKSSVVFCTCRWLPLRVAGLPVYENRLLLMLEPILELFCEFLHRSGAVG
jgi:hypothetical protein